VNEVNQPPVLNPIGPKTIAVGSLLQFTVSASDPDLPVQTLTFSASNLPTGATFNPTTHVFSWTPTSGQDGVYPNVHFAVSDGTLSDTEDITITVTALAPAVSISPTAASILIGHSVSFTSTVSGGHGPFTYQWYVDDVLQPLATGSTFTFTPPTTGIYYVYVKVTDSNSNVAQSETARVVVGAVSVGGHSFSPSKPVANTALAYYVMLLAFFSAVICITRRKRK
jgi:hypothetical protein